MTCPHCGNTADWYDLVDGRSRCGVCFATFETNRDQEKQFDARPKAEAGRRGDE